MTLMTAFFGSNEKLRSGWRFAIFMIGAFVAAAIFSTTVLLLFPGILGEPGQGITAGGLLFNSFSLLVPALVIGWLCGKYLERLPFRALGAAFSGNWLRNLLLGLAIGAVTLLLAVGLTFLLAGTRFSAQNFTGSDILYSLLLSGAIFFVGAAGEEALFRGYIFQTFERSNLTVFAVVFTSLLFATVHQGNPGANMIGWANTFLAGVWFGVAYLKTRDLWFVTGLHFVWNWLQGSLFGIEVSGLTNIVPHPVLKEIETGPAWIGGGDYGIEGGIVTTIAIIASTLAISRLPFQRSIDHIDT